MPSYPLLKKIFFLSSLYSQYGDGSHDQEIKSCMLYQLIQPKQANPSTLPIFFFLNKGLDVYKLILNILLKSNIYICRLPVLRFIINYLFCWKQLSTFPLGKHPSSFPNNMVSFKQIQPGSRPVL